jgi:hypothetical protein
MEGVLGEPEDDLGNGESCWFCPRPECKGRKKPTLVSLPHKPPYPDKFRCRRCGWFGDEYDIIALSNPDLYGEGKCDARWFRRADLRRAYRLLCPDGLHLEFDLI